MATASDLKPEAYRPAPKWHGWESNPQNHQGLSLAALPALRTAPRSRESRVESPESRAGAEVRLLLLSGSGLSTLDSGLLTLDFLQSAQRESNPHFRHGKAVGYRYIMGAGELGDESRESRAGAGHLARIAAAGR